MARAHDPNTSVDADLLAGEAVPVPGVGAAPAAEPADGAPFVLALDDLLPDTAGEIVFDGDLGGPVQLLATDKPVTSGVVHDPHVTEGGIDVTGYAFHAFASGVTLYLPDGDSVSVDAG